MAKHNIETILRENTVIEADCYDEHYTGRAILMAPYGGGADDVVPVPEYYAAQYFQADQIRVTDDGVLQAPFLYDNVIGAVFDQPMIEAITELRRQKGAGNGKV